MEHKLTSPSARQAGWKCSCGEKFGSETLAVKHRDDANFELHEKAKETEDTPAADQATEKPVAPAPDESNAATTAAPGKPAENANTETGESGPAAQAAPPTPPAKPNGKSSVKGFLTSNEVQARIKEMLGKKAAGFTASLISSLNSNALLAECVPATVLSAAMKAAVLDLPIDPNLGFAYIIPYRDNRKGIVEAQFQIGYKGFIQLAQRSGQYKTIAAVPVYEGQLIEENPLTGNTYDWKGKKSEKVVGYVAMFSTINGFQKEWYMPVDELKKHGQRYSQSFRKGYGLWKDDFDAMATKTVLKLLISKYGPMSIDMQQAVVADQAIIEGEANEYPDNVSEVESKLLEAGTTEEINEIMQALPASERKNETVLAAAKTRVAELAE
jgi:recombination protein RecT